MRLSQRIPTKWYKCNPENDSNRRQCLDNFYERKLNCTFPWKKSQQTLQNINQCQNVDQLMSLVKNISIGNELKGFDCWVENCHQKRWKIIFRSDSSPEIPKDGISHLSIQQFTNIGVKLMPTDHVSQGKLKFSCLLGGSHSRHIGIWFDKLHF